MTSTVKRDSPSGVLCIWVYNLAEAHEPWSMWWRKRPTSLVTQWEVHSRESCSTDLTKAVAITSYRPY
eukprot:SM000156S02147  [mRNA]  locus=s156:119144:119356:- [translate_table: standard]